MRIRTSFVSFIVALTIGAAVLSGCGTDDVAAKDPSTGPNPPAGHVLAPAPSEPAGLVSPADAAQNQREKFAYMQSPDRITVFNSYLELKQKLGEAVANGKFGEPKVTHHEGFRVIEVGDETVISASINDDNTVHSISINVPGEKSIYFSDSVHDWPTTVGGKSVDLQYSVDFGELSTCIWPTLDAEMELCDGVYGASTVTQLKKLEYDGLRAFGQQANALLSR